MGFRVKKSRSKPLTEEEIKKRHEKFEKEIENIRDFEEKSGKANYRIGPGKVDTTRRVVQPIGNTEEKLKSINDFERKSKKSNIVVGTKV